MSRHSGIVIFGIARGENFVVGFAASQAALFSREFEGFLAVEFGLVDEFFDAFCQALHRIGGSACVGGIFGADEERDLTLGGALLERSEKLGEFAAAKFFVEFGDFAGNTSGAVAENFASVGNTFGDPMRSFVKNNGAILDAETFKGAAAFAAAGGKKADKKKFFVGQSARGKRGEKRRWSGHGHDGNMVAQAERDQAMSWIGDERHSGVADERYFCALFEGDEQLWGAREFVVFMVADEGFADFVMVEEFLRVARVFAGNLIDFFKDAQRAEGEILEIANRGAHKVQAA